MIELPTMELKRIYNGPGKYLIFMMWWAFIAIIPRLFAYDLTYYFSSYLPLIIPITVTLIVSLSINLLDSIYLLWNQWGIWKKYLILMGAYALINIVSLIIISILSTYRMLDYFGGDPEGSIGMLYLPSIFFYGIVGAIILIINKLVKMIKNT